MLVAALLALAALGPPSATTLRLATEEIFAPDKFFEDGNEHDILTGRFLGRDGYYPSYAIAVRYGDVVANGAGGFEHRLDIRFLRIKGDDGNLTSASALLNRMKTADVRSATDARRFARHDPGLQWLDTDTHACPGAFEAIEAIRKSFAPPSPDYRLVERSEEDAIWMHIPVYEVAMGDLFERVSYRGPPYSNRPSGKLDALVDLLEPCWRPGRAPAPWLLERK